MAAEQLAFPSNRRPPAPDFDAELAGPLHTILASRPSSLTPDRILIDRQRIEDSVLSLTEVGRGGAFDVAEQTVPGPAGQPDLTVLICRPRSGATGILYNMHGGGMVAGHRRSRELLGDLERAEALGMAVVAVEYRLAPEHPDPAPVEDCYAGLCWLADHAAEWELDPARIVVSGASAGGALAAAMALLARDREGPALLGQLLLCPMLDDRCDTPSAHQMDGRGVWDRTSNVTGWTALLGGCRGTERVSPYAAPARAVDVAGLPPAFIDVGAAEALRDEAISYASRIWQAGGAAELHVWSGAFHSFDEWVPEAKISLAAKQARLSWLRRLLASSR